MGKLKVEYIPIESLRPNEYNPRAITDDEKEGIRKSLKEFGMVKPLVVNSAKNRENIIIEGHQRRIVLAEEGWKEVPVVYVSIPNVEKEKS